METTLQERIQLYTDRRMRTVSYKAVCRLTVNNGIPFELRVSYKDTPEEARTALESRIEVYKLTEGNVNPGLITVSEMFK